MRAHGHRIFIRLGERAGCQSAAEVGRQRKHQRALRPLYNEWKKKQTAARRATLRDKGIDTDGMDDAAVEQKYEEYTGKESNVVELDENSELARRVKGLYENKRYNVIMEYLRETI